MSTPSLTPHPETPAGVQASIGAPIGKFLLRRIWLPATVYRLIPWIYVASGGACLGGGIYLPDQAWLWPYVVLLGLMCFHAACLVVGARRS